MRYLNLLTLPSKSSKESQENKIYCYTFNQDYSFFSCCGENGFQIINVSPYKEIFSKTIQQGGIKIIELLYKCNILAMVGGGDHPAFPPNQVILWDDKLSTVIEKLVFTKEVLGVKLHRVKDGSAHIIVHVDETVYIFNFETLDKQKQFKCHSNINSISVSNLNQCVVAFPHVDKGKVQVHFCESNIDKIIKCHEGNIRCVCLNNTGTMLATASDKGTLVRIWDTKTGEKIQELRRGREKAIIHCLSFSKDSIHLLASSQRGTIHVWNLNKANKINNKNNNNNDDNNNNNNNNKNLNIKQNKTSALNFVGGYFKSEWSIARYKGINCPSLCCFGEKDENGKQSVTVFGVDGNYHKFFFHPNKGDVSVAIKKKINFWKKSQK